MIENEWSSAEIERLRVLWDEGHSTAEIGRQMGRSKNAVVGKAHRIGLQGRGSPILRTGRSRPAPKPRRAAAQTLPPLASVSIAARPANEVLHPSTVPFPDRIALGGRGTRIVPPQITSSAVAERRPILTEPSRPCCWPEGEPGTRGFHFCEAPSVMGKPYCPSHCERAYIRIRDDGLAAAQSATTSIGAAA